MTYLGDPRQWMVYQKRLQVKTAMQDFVGRDIVRINIAHRGDFKNHQVVKLTANDRSHFVVVRGRRDDIAIIEMDEETRDKFEVKPCDDHEFTIEEVSWLGQLSWYTHATDPVIRIPAVLAVISAALGLIGLFLGIVSLCK